jgi:hypothetical protein
MLRFSAQSTEMDPDSTIKECSISAMQLDKDGNEIMEIRKSNHKIAEQRRRDLIKKCFDDLRQKLPNLVEKIPSRLHILEKTLIYIRQLEKENTELRLRYEQ